MTQRLGISLQQRQQIADRLARSSYSHCARCRLTWDLVHGHAICYERNSGCFPICDECWDELTPSERVPYYLDWLTKTDVICSGYEGAAKYDTPERRALLEINVLANKQDYHEELMADAAEKFQAEVVQ